MAVTLNASNSGTGGLSVTSDATGNLAFQTAGTTAITVDTSQNVGIGTASPSFKLDVSSSATETYSRIMNTSGSGQSILILNNNSGNWQVKCFTDNTFKIRDNGNSADRMIIDTSGNLQFNSGYGSVTTAYGCRAWVNFNGTTSSPSTIRGSGNVSSVTKNGTGDYTVNFSTSMVDANYSTVSMGGRYPDGTGGESGSWNYVDRYSTSSVRIICRTSPGTFDQPSVFVAVFR